MHMSKYNCSLSSLWSLRFRIRLQSASANSEAATTFTTSTRILQMGKGTVMLGFSWSSFPHGLGIFLIAHMGVGVHIDDIFAAAMT